ncbi:MAG TPA: hypothetical protein VGC48_05705, partial [Gemmatimonadales bacterium]
LVLLACSALSCGEPTSPAHSAETAGPSSVGPSLALAGNSWVRRARIPTARIAHAAGLLDNAAGEPVLYVFGGNDPIEEFPVRTIDAYNYVTNRWTTKASSFHAFHPNGVGTIGGKLYISGGLVNTGDGFASLATLYAYDPVRDVLTRKADMPRVASEGVAGVIGSRLYVLAGTEADQSDAFSRRFYRYDPATDKWATLPSCPRFHRLGAGAVSKGKFYVVGGMGSNVGLDVYDPATNKWRALAAPPVPLVEAAAVATGGKLYVMGPGKSVYAYDPATNRWKTLASMLTGRSQLAAAPLVTSSGNRKILAVGGFNLSDSTSASDNELYTP